MRSKMTNKLLLLLIIVLLITLISCSAPTVKGSGNAVDEERNIDYVSKVDITGNFKVEITCGETNSLKVEAEDNILPLIETKVKDEQLTISTKQKITNLRDVRIILSTHTLTELESDGKSSIIVKGINSDDLELSLDEEGQIEIEGKTDYLRVSLDGEGKILAKELQTKNTYITLFGEGKAELYARKSLKAKVKGSGSIDYWGDPEEISIKASKGGSVNKQ